MQNDWEPKSTDPGQYFEKRRKTMDRRGRYPAYNIESGGGGGQDFESYNAQKDADAQHTSKSKAA